MGKREYLVRFQGKDEESDGWVPAKRLEQSLIVDYWDWRDQQDVGQAAEGPTSLYRDSPPRRDGAAPDTAPDSRHSASPVAPASIAPVSPPRDWGLDAGSPATPVPPLLVERSFPLSEAPHRPSRSPEFDSTQYFVVPDDKATLGIFSDESAEAQLSNEDTEDDGDNTRSSSSSINSSLLGSRTGSEEPLRAGLRKRTVSRTRLSLRHGVKRRQWR